MLHKSKLMLPILAVIVGVAASAFTSARTTNSHDDPTWTYVGPETQTQEQLNTPANYDLGGTTCDGSGRICTVQAPSDGGSPQEPVFNQGDVEIGGNYLIQQKD